MRVSTKLCSLAAAAALGIGALAPAAMAAPEDTDAEGAWDATAKSIALPDTIPSLDNFEAQESGTWTLTNGARVVTSPDQLNRARMLSTELSAFLDATVPAVTGVGDAQSSDVSLILDESRDDLGDEGFELNIGEGGLQVTGKTDAGVFYGTRAVSQLLRQEERGELQLTLPAGQVVSVPEYSERGAILCACQINISPEWIDQFLADLADLRINQVLMEMKVKSDNYPDTNTWSYYTKEDVAKFVEKANELNIDVIPEINSPGHMNIWLENAPQYQLTSRSGVHKPDMLDISNPEARQFVKDIIAEYDDVFTSDYWHMGADEYTIGTSYDEFPQLGEYARETFGPDATPDDAFNAFINEINDYVQSKGKTLRVFNDGLNRSASQKLDKSVIVDYWLFQYKYTPQQFAEDGYQLNNTTQTFYWSRGTWYGVNSEAIYNGNWHPYTFDSNQIADADYEGVRGARVSLWPDNVWMTENEVAMQTSDSIALLAQLTWNDSRPWPQWSGEDGMKAAIDRVGKPVLRNSVAMGSELEGTYSVPGLDSLGEGPWQITPTYDGYYQVKDTASGKCLSINQESSKHLGAVTEVGAPAVLADCADVNKHYNQRGEASNAANHQKWQIKTARSTEDGETVLGLTFRNAVTVQYLAIADGTETHVDIQGVSDPAVRESEDLIAKTLSGLGNGTAEGDLVQFPHDLVEVDGDIAPKAVFSINQSKSMSADVSVLEDVDPSNPKDVTITVHAPGGENLPASEVSVEVTEGWKVLPETVALDAVPMGNKAQAVFTIANTTATEGTATFTWTVGDETFTTEVVLKGRLGPRLCGDGFNSISTNSEETAGEGPVNGHITAAFDTNEDGTADLDTFWHTRWLNGNDEFPFWVVFDPSEALGDNLMATVEYAPRQNKVNGRIKHYRIYLSEAEKGGDADWGEPVLEGDLENSTSWQAIEFDEPVSGQFVKFEITDVWDEVQGKEDTIASAAGFCVSTVIPPADFEAPEQPDNPPVTGDETPTTLPEPDQGPAMAALRLGFGEDFSPTGTLSGVIGEELGPIALNVSVNEGRGYSLVFSPELPEGLVFDAATNTISGVLDEVFKETFTVTLS